MTSRNSGATMTLNLASPIARPRRRAGTVAALAWLQFHAVVARRNREKGSAATRRDRQRNHLGGMAGGDWRQTVERAGPAVANGRVYVAHPTGTVLVLDEKSAPSATVFRYLLAKATSPVA